jgi:hypothetical protein
MDACEDVIIREEYCVSSLVALSSTHELHNEQKEVNNFLGILKFATPPKSHYLDNQDIISK